MRDLGGAEWRGTGLRSVGDLEDGTRGRRVGCSIEEFATTSVHCRYG